MLHDFVHAVTPLMWVGIFIFAITLRHRRKMAQIAQGGQYGQPMQEYAATPRPDQEVEALRDRVRVLERIATASSPAHRHADEPVAEIEALRDR